jgi:uncharacterized protein YndB with AHSA1/START domain
MDARSESERELIFTRTVNGPARLVFEAWTKPELFAKWWVPKSFGLTLLSCDLDARPGGRYRLQFKHGDGTFEAFGQYTEVTPYSRLAWTNDDEGDAGAVTTVTFDEKDGMTVVVVRNLYASKDARDEAAAGAASGLPESLNQLDELVVSLRNAS